jgi:GTPase SAR1 family protein
MNEEKSMRLSQAARILNLNHTKVASVLTGKGYKVDNNPNTKLNYEQLEFLAKEFKSDVLLSYLVSKKKEPVQAVPTNDNPVLYFRPTSKFQTPAPKPATEEAPQPEQQRTEASSLGLKIVGKVDIESNPVMDSQPIPTIAIDATPKTNPIELAQTRIKEFKKTGQTSLNLSDLGLRGIPAELKAFRKLRKLSLANNQIEAIENIPDSVIELDLSNNLISKTEGLTKQVVVLKLNRNYLTDIDNLPNSIQQLEVNHNDIHQVTTCPKSLKYLKINQNQLERINLPPALESLAICHNNLTHIPEIPKKLTELYLYGNAIEDIQPDILGENENTNCLRAIRNYKAELKRRSEPNQIVKLVIVGNSNVGKSSLLRALKGLPHDPFIKSTHAIQLDEIELTDEQKPVRLHVWDLGGQEIYYGTHRIFIKSPAIQLVIFDVETEDKATSPDRFKESEDIRNLKVPFYVSRIEELSPQSKILIVENKSTDIGSPFSSENGYPLLKVNAQDRLYTHTLKALIRDIAIQMPIYDYPVPYYWERVRAFLRQNKPKRITKERFYEICRLEQVLEDGYDDLLEHLHNTGSLYYREELGNDIIVDLIWALEAIYKVFDRRSTFYDEMRTQLNGKCVANTLFDDFDKTDSIYTIEEKWMFLKFMHSCGLCFPLKSNPSDPETRYTHYVFPEFLTSTKPHNVKLWLKGIHKVVYQKQFDFLPYYPLHTFISKFGAKTYYDYFWRSGILIYIDVEELEGFCIEADFERHTLTLTIDGNIASEWYEAIVNSIKVHGDQQNTQWKLISGEIRNHESSFEDTMPKSTSDLEMLPDVAQNVSPPIHRKKKIVISYAKEDIDALKMLETYFKGYSKDFDFWYDQRQDNTSGWEAAVQKEFDNADGYILLISPHYMMVDKKIIHENEIPTILKRQKELSVPVINLFVGAFTLTSSHDVSVFNSFNKGEVMHADKSDAQDFINRFIREEILKKFI